MKSFIFAKRNLRELVCDPLSLLFCFAFPVVIFLLLEIIMSSTGANLSDVPQFMVQNMTGGIIIFSFSFLTMFLGMLIAKDRSSAFLTRLKISPLTAKNFMIGYSLPVAVIAFFQIVITVICGFCFGLSFTANLLLIFIVSIPSLILFISMGLIIGNLFSDKTASAISSLIVNFCAIFGGMFFPLDNMKGGFKTICQILPFEPAIKLVNYTINGQFDLIWKPLVVVSIYAIIFFVIAFAIFSKKLKSAKNDR